MTQKLPNRPETWIRKLNSTSSAQGLWLLLFAVATLVLLVGGYAYYRSVFDRIQKKKYEDLAAIAKIKGEHIRQWRQEMCADSGNLAEGPLFRRALEAWLYDKSDTRLRTAVRDRLATEQESRHFTNVTLLGTDGHLILSAKPDPHPLNPVTKRAIDEALAKGSPVLGDLYQSPDGTILIDAAAPVHGLTGRPLGVLIFRRNAQSVLYPLIQSWPTPSKTAETLLIRKDGQDILFLNNLRHRSNTALSLRKPFTLADLPAVQAVLGKQGKFLGRDYREQEVLADLSHIPDSPWFMVAKVDTSEILKEAYYRGKMIALFCSLFIVLAASGTAYGYRHRQAWLYRELYQKEKEQREAQEEFRATLYSIGDAVITTDTSGLVRQMNPIAVHLTGWVEPDAKGKLLDEVFHIIDEDSRSTVENPVRRILREGVVVGLSNHSLLIAKDGTEHPIADSGSPIRDESGDITGVVLVFRDQTAERKAKKELEESEERYRTVADHTYDWELWLTPDDRLKYCSPSCERVTGYRAEEYINDPSLLDRIVHPDDRAVWEQHISQVAQGYDKCELDYRIITRNREVAWIGHCCSPVYSTDGKLIGRRLSNRDITDRKKAELALEKSEERLRMAQYAASAGTWEWDLLTNKNFWSDECWALYGLKPHSCEPSYETWLETIYPDDRAEAERAFQEAASKGIELRTEWRVNDSNGSKRWLMSRGRPIRDDTGKVLRYIGIAMDITDRKLTEEALADSERKFRLLYEEAPVPYQSLDEEGRLLSVNAAWLQLLGYTLDEVIGKSFTDFLNSWSQERFRETFPAFKRYGEVYGVEHKMVCKDHSIVDVSIDGRVSFEKDGKFKQTHCVFQDITQRKRAETALKESEEKYRATFNTASVGIDLVDRYGRFLVVNRTMAQFLGYTPEELRHHTVLDVTHPEDVPRSKELHDAIVQGQTEGYRIEKRYVRKDGSIMWADLSVAVIRDATGQHKTTVGVINDITRQKESEEARIRLEAVVEQAAEAVEITDPQGTIVYVNPSFERTTGYSSEEAIGNNTHILKSGHHDKEFYKRLWNTIADGRTWTGHFVNKKKDGTLFEEDASISPVKDASGKIVNFVAVKRDVTREVYLQKQFHQAQKMEAIGTLAGGIAHDFNNILQVILGFSELLMVGKSKKDSGYEDLRKIHHAAGSGRALVRNLLTFSRKVEPKAVPLDLNNQIRQVEKLLHRTIPKMIEIRTKLAEGLKRVHADPGQMEQVVMNLAVNARDAMGEKGTLTIQTENVFLDNEYCRFNMEAKPGDHVLLSVSDTGIGMSGETLQHIFEPFYTTKELGRGTGLGLAMVYGVVKQHDGHVTCYSEVGKGTTFRIYLPAITSVPRDVAAEPAMKMSDFGTETLLLVDDEDLVRELGKKILTKAGYSVLMAANGKEALAVYEREKEQISLVILDLIMPSMGGKDCLQELLKIDPAAKVLIASGYAADDAAKEYTRLGAKGFVNKPFSLKDLLQQVRKTLDDS